MEQLSLMKICAFFMEKRGAAGGCTAQSALKRNNSGDGGTHKGCVAIIVFCSIAILMCLHVLFVAICKAKCL